MFSSVFQVFIVQPIFNLLTLIYALLPGHNFGLALILFTITIRVLMWPLVKKQLHHTKAMRGMQPELKKIKAAAKGDRQKESLLTMELYKERQINPLSPLGVLAIQLVVLIGLYQGLSKVIADPHALINGSYDFIRNMSWLKNLAGDINQFDASLLGFIDLKRAALSGGAIYWPAMFLVAGSAISQYFQSKQLMPDSKDSRKLRQILKDASSGKQSDSSEVNAAVSRNTKFLIPIMIFVFTVNIASALSLYWLVSGVTAYLQQAKILGQDEQELEAIADKPGSKVIIEGEVISKKTNKPSASSRKKSSVKNKRRKR